MQTSSGSLNQLAAQISSLQSCLHVGITDRPKIASTPTQHRRSALRAFLHATTRPSVTQTDFGQVQRHALRCLAGLNLTPWRFEFSRGLLLGLDEAGPKTIRELLFRRVQGGPLVLNFSRIQPHGMVQNRLSDACKLLIAPPKRGLVPKAGLEPARPFGLEILSLLCLPFHHSGRARTIMKHAPR